MSRTGKRRRWKAEEKLRIVLAGMENGVEVSDLCRREPERREPGPKKTLSGWRITDRCHRNCSNRYMRKSSGRGSGAGGRCGARWPRWACRVRATTGGFARRPGRMPATTAIRHSDKQRNDFLYCRIKTVSFVDTVE